MPERWLGITNNGNSVDLVYVELDDPDTVVFLKHTSKKLIKNEEKAFQYADMFRRLQEDIASNNDIVRVVIKGSDSIKGSLPASHIPSLELRGVTIAAAGAAGKPCSIIYAGATSTNVTKGKSISEYIKDEEFWREIGLENMSTGHRKIVLLMRATYMQGQR